MNKRELHAECQLEHKQEQVKNSINLFIGLGGTGIDCIKQIKKNVTERIMPDESNSDVEEYKHIRFLALDSDDRVANKDDIFPLAQKDYFSIYTSHMSNMLPFTEKAYSEYQWLSNDIEKMFISNCSAGAVR